MEHQLPPFWANVIQEFYRTSRARKTLLKGTSVDQLVDAMISTLAGDHASALKCNVLVFMGQAAEVLLESDAQVQRVCGALSKLLGVGAEVCVECQTLLTLTSIIVSVEAGVSVLHSFVEVLFEKVQQHHVQPLLRSFAAECLEELERCFPRLLQESMGTLAVLAQTDTSFALQSLSTLMLEGIGHVMVPGKKTRKIKKKTVKKKKKRGAAKKKKKKKPTKTKSSSNLRKLSQGLGFLTPHPLLPFEMPEDLLLQPEQLRFDDPEAPTNLLQERSLIELQKLMAMVASDSASLFCPSARMHVVMSLLALAKRAGKALPFELFKQHFCSFSSSNDPLLVHALLLIRREGELAPAFDEALVGRLLSCADDESLAPETRALCVSWLSELHEWCNMDAALLYGAYPRLLPSSFDPTSVKHAKLSSLVSCFSDERPPPERLMGVLVCLEEFKCHQSDDFVTRVAFGVLSKFLSALPSKFPEVYGFLLDTLVSHPRFLANVVTLLDHTDNERITTQLLLNFNDLFSTLSPQQLLEYLPLIERVVRAPDVDPVALIKALERAARETSLCAGSWQAGNALIGVCREAMVHYCHGGRALYKSLSELLFYLSQYFSDVELRDRAHFYYFLLTHLPPTQMLHILTDPPPKESSMSGSGPSRQRAGTSELPAVAPPDEVREATCLKISRDGPAVVQPGAKIDIPVLFSFESQDEDGPQSAAAIDVAFMGHADVLEPISQLQIPFLAAMPRDSVVNVSDPPYVAHTKICLRVKLPVPVEIAVSAIFTNPDSKTERVKLSPFPLCLEDFFCQPAEAASSWDALWEQPLEETVYSLDEPVAALLERLHPKLGKFAVGEGRFLIGLAPSFVLLILVEEAKGDLPRMQGQHSVAWFKTNAPASVSSAYHKVVE